MQIDVCIVYINLNKNWSRFGYETCKKTSNKIVATGIDDEIVYVTQQQNVISLNFMMKITLNLTFCWLTCISYSLYFTHTNARTRTHYCYYCHQLSNVASAVHVHALVLNSIYVHSAVYRDSFQCACALREWNDSWAVKPIRDLGVWVFVYMYMCDCITLSTKLAQYSYKFKCFFPIGRMNFCQFDSIANMHRVRLIEC